MRDHIRAMRRDPLLLCLWLALLLFAALWLAPCIFIVFTSLKTFGEITNSGVFEFPKELTFANYTSAWSRGGFEQAFFNSVFISFVKVPLGIAISALAAYALAQMTGRFTRPLFLFFLFGTMIPFQVMLAPIFTLVNSFGLIDTYVGLILPYLAFGIPFQVFILHGFFKTMPKEIAEAAEIDGAGHFTRFRRIYLPIMTPILSALFILDFVATWNEFAMALVIMQNKAMWTLPLGLMSFQGQFMADYGGLNAAIVITVIPAVMVYLIFQRYFVSGLAAGAVKG
ncbi:carbohydrate ABC transporter permease [Tropicibacter sp. R15_0]|uniref:carbohydrate ABC transporter permease n=1 Tax=Tropicibacter sp. R15_0 TaxID=2821101 RepID=UPI001ADBAB20|nr:carbohydrate ABC transporter permease [Tropicibacter sp. R15_0]MBO9467782.1 carbohydrate ABC transporter permease [Tropicibacter sp. R15_0]